MISFLMANAAYKLRNDIEKCTAKTLILVGGRESVIMRKSAETLHMKIQNSSLEILPDYYHGDLSINHSDLYVRKAMSLISN